ncbi:MAG TPA: lysylphosphatidylglycerol synthase transmembrane domain-containing protein [Polyangiales bacterium]|nr:lysylphosphatidylglycerol synthase transmembrane domain-containing protein [Polyangiales bacterium]
MATPKPARGMTSLVPKLGASLLIASGFVYVLNRGGLPIWPGGAALSHVAVWAVPAYALVYCLAALLRTYRWIYLLRPIHADLSARRVLGIGLVGFTAVLFAPLRAGEVVRPWLLAQDGEITFVQATGTVAAERIVDGLMLTLILFAGMASTTTLSPLPTHVGKLALPVAAVHHAAVFALVLFSSAFAAMFLFYFFRGPMTKLVRALLSPISEKLAHFATDKLSQLVDGFRFLPSLQHGAAFFRDTLVYWAVCALSMLTLMRGAGLPASFGQACVTMGIMGLGSLIPSGPGFFGTYQLSAYCALAMFFPESAIVTQGAAFTFVSYATQLVITALSCVVGFALMSKSVPEVAS